MLKKMLFAIALLAVLSGTFLLRSEHAYTYTVYENLPYGEADYARLDLFVPSPAYTRYENGCVLLLHGGAWISGSRKEFDAECRALAEHGYLAATMDYTLGTEENLLTASVDTMLDDIGAAIEALAAFSEENGLSISRLALSGYSAGAHLSMLYAYSRGAESAIPLVFTANRAGPADFRTELWGGTEAMIVPALAGLERTAAYAAEGRYAELAALVSPVTYIGPDSPPSLLAYGGQDTTVSVGNGEAVRAALERAGVPCDYILYPNSDHALQGDPEQEALYQETLYRYCARYFGY